MKKAIISVSNKENLPILIDFLIQNDYNIISTGGTYKFIHNYLSKQNKNRVIQVSDFTGFPEILEGRVKTLHPKIYSGILYDPNNSKHQVDFKTFSDSNHQPFNLEKIDLVVCNLYPFEEVKNSDASYEEIIENIDIGGVSLIRAAAKNYINVFVLVNPDMYNVFIDSYKYYNNLEIFKKELASYGFEYVTHYDQIISSFMNSKLKYRTYKHVDTLKYGCNPYQNNSFIFSINNEEKTFELLNGSPGYINYIDALHSWRLVYEVNLQLNNVCSASFKHTAPAGVALGNNLLTNLEKEIYNLGDIDTSESPSSRAFVRARNCDPLSSFGDFIAISSIVDETCAKLIKREVTDGIIAKGYTEDALKILKSKKGGKFYILQGKNVNYNEIEYREIGGIAISQKCNSEQVTPKYCSNIVTNNKNLPTESVSDLMLATITLKYTPSNSIAIAHQGMVIGVGAGQQNRVDCLKLAGNKSRLFMLRQHPLTHRLISLFNDNVKRQDKVNAIVKYINNDFSESELINWKSLFREEIPLLDEMNKNEYLSQISNLSLSSDAFFPFRDNIDYASKYGIKYIVQPGGSVQDNNIIGACNEYNMTMAFSNKRMFLH